MQVLIIFQINWPGNTAFPGLNGCSLISTFCKNQAADNISSSTQAKSFKSCLYPATTDRPMGSPVAVRKGIVSCGRPANPAIQLSCIVCSRVFSISSMDLPVAGAGPGVVGSTRSPEEPSNPLSLSRIFSRS